MTHDTAKVSPLATAPNLKSRASATGKAALYLLLAFLAALLVSSMQGGNAADGHRTAALRPHWGLLAHMGFHAAWNFTQSFVFGLANSGGRSPEALASSSLRGSPLLTGGSAGPEGSVLALLAIAALAANRPFRLEGRSARTA